jgi:hypothetical protein
MNCGSINPIGYRETRVTSSVNILDSKQDITLRRQCETNWHRVGNIKIKCMQFLFLLEITEISLPALIPLVQHTRYLPPHKEDFVSSSN